MERPQQRPRFSFDVPLTADEVVARLEAGLSVGPDCVGSVSQRHCWMHMRKELRHFWSPSLDLTVQELEEGTRLRGRFAPHPNIWTMFMFVYAVLGFGAIIGGVFGFAQMTLGEPPWAFAAAGGALALIGFVYGATFIGQGLGAEQMTEMRLFLDRAVGPGTPSGPPS